LHAHYRADVVDAERFAIAPGKLDAIARLGGHICVTIRDRFEMKTPKPDDRVRQERDHVGAGSSENSL
jgi:hypothetical protein